MLSGLLILFFSLLLFSYWFRYTCGVLLRAPRNERALREQVRLNHLSSLEIRAKLRSQPAGAALASLHVLVERDFQFVRFLVQHTAGMESLETRMLMLDYRLMQVWYALTLHVLQSQARKALEEMAGVVGCLAQKMDARATSFLEA